MASNRRYYDAVAGHYDGWHVEVGSAKIVDEVNRERLFAVVGERRFCRALDLACGSGRVLPWLADLAESRWGLDLSRGLLRIAQGRNIDVNLVEGEVLNLPFPNASFDLVVINGGLHHFFNLQDVVREVGRILEPGGLFAVLGEPQAGWQRLDNPFFVLSSLIFALGRPFLHAWRVIQDQKLVNKGLCREPDAEAISPRGLEACCRAAGVRTINLSTYDFLPRRTSSHPIYLRIYRVQLWLERRVLQRRFRLQGHILRYFGTKQ